MPPDPAASLDVLARVIVRIGVNLQPGQRLLVTEPYEMQGVDRSAARLVGAVERAAADAGGSGTEVIWSDPARLREQTARADWRGLEAGAEAHARRLGTHLRQGGAFLFLLGSHPQLLADIDPGRVNEMRNISWSNFGPISAELTAGATQWTLAPVPVPEWADAVYAELPETERMPALWQSVLTACRCLGPDPLTCWQTHLAGLTRQSDDLNRRRMRTLRYHGDGTDLRVKLPSRHRWCTARLVSRAGIPFVANLPTDEVYTAPAKNSAEGTLRVSRPIAYGGTVIEGIELKFRSGSVVGASARTGADLLHRLIETDRGSRRLGEVALVTTGWEASSGDSLPARRSHYQHPLLDENLTSHVALGAAYRFCHAGVWGRWALNQSLIHVDLPLQATAEFG